MVLIAMALMTISNYVYVHCVVPMISILENHCLVSKFKDIKVSPLAYWLPVQVGKILGTCILSKDKSCAGVLKPLKTVHAPDTAGEDRTQCSHSQVLQSRDFQLGFS